MALTVDGCFQLKGNEAMTMLNGNQTELARKEANLIAGIEEVLPDFARGKFNHGNLTIQSCFDFHEAFPHPTFQSLSGPHFVKAAHGCR